MLSHAKGRDDSLAKNESYVQAQKKLGADAQVVWFVDIARVLKLAAQAPGAQAGGGQGPQIEGIIEATGLKSLKAAAGSFALNSGSYDSLSKTDHPLPGPGPGGPQGLHDAPGQPPPRALGPRLRRQLPVGELGPRRRLSTRSTTWSTCSSPAS